MGPDFKTIADFRKDNGEAVRGVCREFVPAPNAGSSGCGRPVASGSMPSKPSFPQCFNSNSDAFGRAVYSGLGIDPLGRFIYATCPTGIWVYEIGTAKGTLVLEPGSPYIPGTQNPTSIVVTN